MTVRHMKIFLQVYQTQNITQAARLLHMTQPAVTRAIQEMEHYYGVRLFERINRRLSVTEIGKQLYSQAFHIVNTFDEMEKSMRNWDAFGVLRIGASITIGNFLMPDLVWQFQDQHPHLKVQVQISNGASILQALLNNQLDLALVEGTVSEPELYTEVFDHDRLVLITPPNHAILGKNKILLKDLISCPLLLREKGSAGRTYLDHIFAVHGLKLEPLWESASTQAIVKAVCRGIGLSLLPDQLVHQDILDGIVKTRSIDDETFERQHCLVWHKQKYLTTAAKDFITLCKDQNR